LRAGWATTGALSIPNPKAARDNGTDPAWLSSVTRIASKQEAQMTPKGVFLFLTAAIIILAIVSFGQRAAVPRQPTKHSLAQQNVKELLLLMDTDKNGKISKQEWMTFMEAEFDALDKDKKGELDQKELLQSTVSVKRVRASDLGK
jgi:uncharacterized protein HemX